MGIIALSSVGIVECLLGRGLVDVSLIPRGGGVCGMGTRL